MAQTYCVRADIVSVIGDAALLACIDDDHNMVESAAETLHVTNAIERAAVEMNIKLRQQYKLSELASNAWCKWANTLLAVYYLRTRRANPVESSVAESVVEIRELLEDISWGRRQLPEQAPSFEHIAAVSNYQPEIHKLDAPIRVDTEESTGASPGGNRKRQVAGMPGYL